MSLNDAQRQAVQMLSGPLLVLAGAGTGKTRVVTVRIAKLIETGTSPERILAVTFTNKAAREMRERAMQLLGSSGGKGGGKGRGKKDGRPEPEISTFHSLCVRILRRHATLLGYPAAFGICDRGDQEAFARGVLREINISQTTLRPGDLLSCISNWKNASVRPNRAAALAQSDQEHLAAAAYRRYQETLKLSGVIDFDDLLLCTEDLFERFPDVREQEADRFDHLLVDEYQDTNGSQYRIVKALAQGHRNLCVVGDDDQSIYGWRGAEVTHILRFSRDWPDATVVRLETNYRSTHEIIDWANRLIRFNGRRHDKTLRATFGGEPPRILQLEDEVEEAEVVVEEIRSRINRKVRLPGEIAILFRTNEQPRAFETELRRQRVPYVLIGGQSFFDRKEVRDLLAYLKTIDNPSDEVSLLRILNTPPRGIGTTTVKRLLEAAVEEGTPLWKMLLRAESVGGLSQKAVAAVDEFTGKMQEFQQRVKSERPALDRLLRDVIHSVGYLGEIERIYQKPDEREARTASVEELVSAASIYHRRERRPTLTGFLQENALTAPTDDDKESKLDIGSVVLMTLHSAKGLEFPEVYMVGMEEGILPHRRSVDAMDETAIDEERRLCYVGVTRAQKRLTLTMALARTKWGKPRPTLPSRFLFELTGKSDNPKYDEVRRKSVQEGRGKQRRGAKKKAVSRQSVKKATRRKRP